MGKEYIGAILWDFMARDDPCPHCDEPLNDSQDEQGWKSCPECSVDNGEHVFRPLSDFGHTETRGTGHEPDGVQSWCSSCRGRGEGSGRQKDCSDMDDVRNE